MLSGLTSTTVVPLVPCETETFPGCVERLKSAGGITLTLIVVVRVKPPPVPVIVTTTVLVGAVLFAVRVSVLVVVAL